MQVSPVLPQLLTGSKKLRKTAIQLAADLKIESVIPQLTEILDRKSAADEDRVASFQALIGLTKEPQNLLQKGLKHELEPIRVAALSVLAKTDPEVAIPKLFQLAKTGPIASRQKAIRLLGEIKRPAAVNATADLLEELANGSLPNSVVLDLLQAATESGDESLAKQVERYRTEQQQAGTEVSKWSECLEGGNADRGRNVFFGKATASCRRCHKVDGKGTNVGPDLSSIATTKDRSYLLEAIVDPNKSIAKGFETTVIINMQGLTLSGIIQQETETHVKMVTAQGTKISIAVDDIDERFKGQSGMPSDLAKNLTRSEVRDLVEYLSTLKSGESGRHGEGE